MWFLLSDGRVGHALGLRSDSQARAIFAIFEILLLNLRAWQSREPLRLNAREKLTTRYEVTGWSVPVGVGIISLVLALTLPIREIAWSGWVYFSTAFLVPLHSAYRKRRDAGETDIPCQIN